jgi:autonomous glycyl radical cofactor GrcA
MAELRSADEYWIPSVSNFPTIDAAIVSSNTLYAFQMRVSADLTFNVTRFQQFEQAVRSSESFPDLRRDVVVYFVRPSGTSAAVPADVANLKFRPHEVDTASIDTIASSLRQLFEFTPRTEVL